MLRLPQSLKQSLRTDLEDSLQGETLFEVVRELSRVVLRHLPANDAVFSFESGGGESFTSVISETPNGTSEFSDGFISHWIESHVHDEVLVEMQQRLSPASFSSFSWPFPHVKARDGSGYLLPRNYCVIIPFGSKHIVHNSQEQPFSGYLALLFPGFPQLEEDFIHLIITLPTLVSEILAVSERRIRQEKHGIDAYAHEVKHFLLLSQQLTQELQHAEDDAGVERYSKRLSRATRRMLLFTNSVLLSERVANGEFSISPMTLCLNELVTEVYEDMLLLIESSGVDCRLELSPTLPDSSIDPALFPVVLSNLLDNAMKFSPSGTSVAIRTSTAENGNVRLEVEDCGLGIPLADRDHVFSKHYQGDNNCGGSGLGLFLARNIVEAHGGHIHLRSEGPTCFCIEIPALVPSRTAVTIGDSR